MKLTICDLSVISDTLNHSLLIGNYGGRFTTETREDVLNKILDIMDSIEITLQVENETGLYVELDGKTT